MNNRFLIASLLLTSAASVFADEPSAILNPTVVTATRVEENSFDVPVSVDVVKKDSIQDAQLGMTLSESLIRVPGLTAQNRTQFSQDPQISTRGFGARSAFGVRGIRIYVDGIPLTMPDGIAQPGNIDLENIKSIEVMRGPFSTMYGSSSGGVIQLQTNDAPKMPEIKINLLGGSYGTNKTSSSLTGTLNDIQYLLSTSHFETDGYRDHSAAWKDQSTAQVKFNLSNGTRANILIDYVDSRAQDPLGLARVAGTDKNSDGNNHYYSVFSDPKSVPDAAYLANTRVSRKNTQVGLNLEHDINDKNTLRFVGSLGHRDNLQYLALPLLSTDTSNLSRGRASSIGRDFWNSELSWVNKGEVLNKKYTLVTGISYGWMEDARRDVNTKFGEILKSRGYNSYISGMDDYGNINRNETDKAFNFDQFVQGQIAVLDNLDLHTGVRHSKVNLKFTGNPEVAQGTDINGSTSFEKTTPAVGLLWKATPSTNLYANYGKGFETPTLIEMAYASQSSPSTGPNLNLKPSTSDNYEVGIKSFLTPSTRINAALFRTDTRDEIIIAQNLTYSVYGNASKTKRQGLEVSIESELQNNLGLYAAYTYLDATFDKQYTSAIKAGTDGEVYPGYKIPGTYKQQLYGEISWKYPELGFRTALEGRANSRVFINDVNSDEAPGYAIANIRANFEQGISGWKLSEYARIENIFDRSYIGAVRINDNNNRNFEAAPGRNYMAGVSATYHF